jgi:hypothetical protein
MTDPRSLDALDPPPWDAAASDASYLVRRSHDLRSKPVDDFDIEDLRLMIGQTIGLRFLVPMALDRLQVDPLAEGDYFPGDLLLNVIRIESSFWTAHPALATQLDRLLASIPTDASLEPELSKRISAFRTQGA